MEANSLHTSSPSSPSMTPSNNPVEVHFPSTPCWVEGSTTTGKEVKQYFHGSTDMTNDKDDDTIGISRLGFPGLTLTRVMPTVSVQHKER